MLPGWGSAWKVPSSITWPSRLSSSSLASACRASAGSPAEAASSGRPAKNCMTSTRSPQYGSYGAGTRTPSSLAAVAAATAVMFRASIRRSSSSRSASANPWARSTAPTDRPQRVPRCSRVASRCTTSRSEAARATAPGRRTLTTTRSPDDSVAACTWAMEAAAIGSSSKLANFSLTGPPSESSSTALTSGHGTLGASS